ncbi:MAG: hypothetical protein K5694_01530 [Bacilli bacterium]|nr:hypothetical protein [Bacilli bacterium]
MENLTRALVLYHKGSGHKDFAHHIPYIKEELGEKFPVLDFVETHDKEEASKFELEAYKNYDVLIVVGGDGTFYNAINNLMQNEKRPVIGYLNFGTIGDVGRTYGISASLKKGVQIIKDGYIIDSDLGQIEDKYFAYSATIGAFSDIAYAAKRSKKKKAGRLSYYFLAVKEAFIPSKVRYSIKYDKETIVGETNFLMALNGRHIGGFKVNKAADINDGKMEIFYAKKGIFNGLPRYLLKNGVLSSSLKECEITTENENTWCLDGEKVVLQEKVKIKTAHNAIKLFSKKPI